MVPALPANAAAGTVSGGDGVDGIAIAVPAVPGVENPGLTQRSPLKGLETGIASERLVQPASAGFVRSARGFEPRAVAEAAIALDDSVVGTPA